MTEYDESKVIAPEVVNATDYSTIQTNLAEARDMLQKNKYTSCKVQPERAATAEKDYQRSGLNVDGRLPEILQDIYVRVQNWRDGGPEGRNKKIKESIDNSVKELYSLRLNVMQELYGNDWDGVNKKKYEGVIGAITDCGELIEDQLEALNVLDESKKITLTNRDLLEKTIATTKERDQRRKYDCELNRTDIDLDKYELFEDSLAVDYEASESQLEGLLRKKESLWSEKARIHGAISVARRAKLDYALGTSNPEISSKVDGVLSGLQDYLNNLAQTATDVSSYDNGKTQSSPMQVTPPDAPKPQQEKRDTKILQSDEKRKEDTLQRMRNLNGSSRNLRNLV
jgi:hypothetical protein